MEVNKVYCGKMEGVLKDFKDNCVDSIVTDPPYGLKFMGKKWDYSVPTVEQWGEAIRVIKPGGYMLCACGTRTQHRMVVNIEDAGFEIRDVITWHYGSGFPKSLDISKAIDKQAGVERTIIGEKVRGDVQTAKDKGVGFLADPANRNNVKQFGYGTELLTEAATDEAKQWEGWGTALKPATEFWTLCRKPISENTVAENVLKYGTGGLNIDGCRVGVDTNDINHRKPSVDFNYEDTTVYEGGRNGRPIENLNPQGRFPANVILDEFMGAELDKQSGNLTSGTVNPNGFKGEYTANVYGKFANNQINPETVYGDTGGASRFFYCPKPDNFERNKGLKNFEAKPTASSNQSKAELNRGNLDFERTDENATGWSSIKMKRNHHPTVKPIDLMRYLVRLVTKKGGIVLDPFCGSGTTCIAAKMELMNYIGIDMDETNIPLAEARIKLWNPDLYKPQQLF